jgi:hypothetical protein
MGIFWIDLGVCNVCNALLVDLGVGFGNLKFGTGTSRIHVYFSAGQQSPTRHKHVNA